MNRKFHPMPTSRLAHQKWATLMPAPATMTQMSRSATPPIITLARPKRRISDPVKNEGANMPTTCQPMTEVVDENGWPQINIASGVAVIRRFITP